MEHFHVQEELLQPQLKEENTHYQRFLANQALHNQLLKADLS